MPVEQNNDNTHIFSALNETLNSMFSFVYYFFPKLHQQKFNFLVDFCLFHLQCTANFKRCIVVFYFSFRYYIFAVPLSTTGSAQFSEFIRCIFFSKPLRFLSVSISAENNAGSCPYIQHQSWRKTVLWFLSRADGKLKAFCLHVGRLFKILLTLLASPLTILACIMHTDKTIIQQYIILFVRNRPDF
jgi:hypothetical protein